MEGTENGWEIKAVTKNKRVFGPYTSEKATWIFFSHHQNQQGKSHVGQPDSKAMLALIFLLQQLAFYKSGSITLPLPRLLLLSCFSRVRLCATPETQPTRLPRPWDSPGKNTGVGCHFLLHCMKVKSESESEVALSCPTLTDPMDCSLPGSSVHGIFQARVLEWGAIAFSLLISC